jgi:hypothetical protein
MGHDKQELLLVPRFEAARSMIHTELNLMPRELPCESSDQAASVVALA